MSDIEPFLIFVALLQPLFPSALFLLIFLSLPLSYSWSHLSFYRFFYANYFLSAFSNRFLSFNSFSFSYFRASSTSSESEDQAFVACAAFFINVVADSFWAEVFFDLSTFLLLICDGFSIFAIIGVCFYTSSNISSSSSTDNFLLFL